MNTKQFSKSHSDTISICVWSGVSSLALTGFLFSLVSLISRALPPPEQLTQVYASDYPTCDKHGCSCYPITTDACAETVKMLTGCKELTCGPQGREGLCACGFTHPHDS